MVASTAAMVLAVAFSRLYLGAYVRAAPCPVRPRGPVTTKSPPATLSSMRRRSVHRPITSLFVALSLLFSQLALANYVCPGQESAAVMTKMMVAGEPCEGMDQAQPVLCHQHSAGAAQSFEMVKVATLTMPAIVQVLALPLVLEAQRVAALPVALAPEARPPPDPLFLSTLRLRV